MRLSVPHQLALNASGFNIFGGRWPLNSATTFSAAMLAIFVRVSNDAEAICGASTTFGRFSPGSMNGSFSYTSRAAPASFPLSSACTRAASSTTGPARSIDQKCRRLHAGKFGAVEQSASIRKQRHVHADEIRLGQQRIEIAILRFDFLLDVLGAPESHHYKSPSSGIPPLAAPLLGQCGQIPLVPASSPTRRSLQADPGPSPSNCRSAPIVRLRPSDAPQP